MESTSSTNGNEESHVKRCLQKVIDDEKIAFLQEMVDRLPTIIKNEADKRSEFAETVTKQLWEKNSQVDALQKKFDEYRERNERKLDNLEGILEEEREKLKEERELWALEKQQIQKSLPRDRSNTETAKVHSEIHTETEDYAEKLQYALERCRKLEDQHDENMLKTQHHEVSLKLMEEKLREKSLKIREMNQEIIDLRAQSSDKSERIQELIREIDSDRRERRSRDDQWNAILDAEQLKCQDLEREVGVLDQYSADWKSYAQEIEHQAADQAANFAGIIARKDREIENLRRQVRSRIGNSVTTGHHSSYSSSDDFFLPPIN